MNLFKKGGLAALLILLCSTVHYGQWCCLDTSLIIADDSRTTVLLQISGAINDSLSRSDQGLCGVRLKFKHKFIGDLRMTLRSPFGQELRLTGPIGNSGSTDFTLWNVSFVPCQDTAFPDPGFNKNWSNLQSWGILKPQYTGTYYPPADCLEKIDTGSVNGIWTLHIDDLERLYNGEFFQICLLFCDPEGINCQSCAPNGGIISGGEQRYCEGDTALKFHPKIHFPVFKPDTLLYKFRLGVSRNDTLLYFTDSVDLQTAPPGSYEICGFSYLREDSSSLPKLPLADFQSYRAGLFGINPDLCGEFSRQCLRVIIGKKPAPREINTVICPGDTLWIEQKPYFDTGYYPNIRIPTISGCDSIIHLRLSFAQLNIDIQNPNTITCDQPEIILDISKSQYGHIDSVLWWTQNGQIMDQSDPLRVVVSKGGRYYMRIAQGYCSLIDSIDVSEIKRKPQLIVEQDSFTCRQKSIWLRSINTNVRKIEWRYNGAVISRDSAVHVSAPGQYELLLVNRWGCRDSVLISTITNYDTIKPVLNIPSISCRDSMPVLRADWVGKDSIHFWELNNTQVFSDSLIISQSGRYQFTIVSEGGCRVSIDTFVADTRKIPNYAQSVDTLNCRDTVVQILTQQELSNSNNWTGPFSFRDTSLQPFVNVVGRYYLHLVDTGGCHLDTFIDVHGDFEKPQIQLSHDSISCLQDTVIIRLSAQDSLVSVLWTNDAGFMSNLRSPVVREPGNYYVRAEGLNGCLSFDTIRVEKSTDVPSIMLSSLALTCNRGLVTINAESPTAVNYNWSGPMNFNSTLEDPIVDQAGIYKLIVHDQFGCRAEKSIQVIDSTQEPVLNFKKTDTINCRTRSADIKVNSQWILDSIRITDPKGSNHMTDSINVTEGGQYFIYAFANTGCKRVDTVIIVVDTIKPIIQLFADTIKCGFPSANIWVNTVDSVEKFLWRLPNGTNIESDSIKTSTPGLFRLTATASNGCNSADSIVVLSDIAYPVFQMMNDTLDCLSDSIYVKMRSNQNDLNILWFDTSGLQLSMEDSVKIFSSGWIFYNIVNSKNCNISDSIFVFDKRRVPEIDLRDTVFTCHSMGTYVLPINTTETAKIRRWTLPDQTNLYGGEITNPAAGKYLIEFIANDDCVAYDSCVVRYDTVAAVISGKVLDTLDCGRRRIRIDAHVDSMGIYQWFGPMNFRSDSLRPLIENAGQYILEVNQTNGCQSTANFEIVMDTVKPVVRIDPASLTCYEPSQLLRFQTRDSIANAYWLGPGGVRIDSLSPRIAIPGLWQVFVRGRNSCVTLDSLYVLDRTQPPIVSAQGARLYCDSDSAVLQGMADQDSVTYLWRGPNNFTSSTKDPVARSPGDYVFIVENKYGCKDSVQVVLVDSTSEIGDINFDIYQPDCQNREFGSIELVQPIGGVGPFQYALNTMPYQSQNAFRQLSPGRYALSVRDIYRCQFDTIFQIDSFRRLTVDAGPDRILTKGQSTVLAAVISPAHAKIQNIQWQPAGSLSCADCVQPTASPSRTTTYTITVTDSFGCVATDEVRIALSGNIPIWIPNAFSPDGNGINDKLQIVIGVDVEKVEEVTIFNRWGVKVYYDNSISNNELSGLWDGTYRGRDMTSDVYVITVIGRLMNAERVKIVKDILLVR